VISAAEQHGFDWRMIAAQIYQESQFDPKARSHAGAYGLMQLTVPTARSLGVGNIFDPQQNILAGVKHLKELYDYFDEISGSDRLSFALAAYNIGQGHIGDARILAQKMGLNPDRWSSLTQTLPLLRYRKYYQDSMYGYCRGMEPVTYIKHIMIYYDILKRQAIEYTADPQRNPEIYTVEH
jgi:membrane-bound lytic murein transglycosylase F